VKDEGTKGRERKEVEAEAEGGSKKRRKGKTEIGESELQVYYHRQRFPSGS
jgi:hypothetical protein